MAGHTMTLVEDTKVWLIGGFSSADYFSDLVYEYDASNLEWSQVVLSGAPPTGTLYYSPISSIWNLYIFWKTLKPTK